MPNLFLINLRVLSSTSTSDIKLHKRKGRNCRDDYAQQANVKLAIHHTTGWLWFTIGPHIRCYLGQFLDHVQRERLALITSEDGAETS